jgi:hypothetical protein
MSALPNTENIHCALHTTLSRQQVADLLRPLGGTIRKCAWDELELRCPWAELIIESESPVLLHGSVADLLTNADRLLSPMREAGVAYTAECHDEDGELVRELRWGLD